MNSSNPFKVNEASKTVQPEAVNNHKIPRKDQRYLRYVYLLRYKVMIN